MTLTFGYWDVRGRGAAIRNLLRYSGADYREEFYDCSSFDKWFANDKQTLGLDFPNLPYLIDGDLKLSQTHAILRYLGRKFNLAGKTDPCTAKEDMVFAQIQEICDRMIITNYYKTYPTDEDFQAELVQLRKDLDNYLEPLEKYLHNSKSDWLTGASLSYVDFYGYEIIDWYRQLIASDFSEKYSNLAAFMKRFEQLKPLREYLATDEYRKAPIFGPFAKIGNTRR